MDRKQTAARGSANFHYAGTAWQEAQGEATELAVREEKQAKPYTAAVARPTFIHQRARCTGELGGASGQWHSHYYFSSQIFIYQADYLYFQTRLEH